MRRLSKWPVIARKAGQLLQESVASCARIRNNQFTTLITAVDAIGANIDNPEYLKELYAEILNKKNDYHSTMIEVRAMLEEKVKNEN